MASDNRKRCHACGRVIRTDRATAKRIVGAVARRTGLTMERLLSAERSKILVTPRFMIAYLMRDLLGWSFPEIGHYIGRDHTTVIYAVRSMEKRIAENETISIEVMSIKAELRAV